MRRAEEMYQFMRHLEKWKRFTWLPREILHHFERPINTVNVGFDVTIDSIFEFFSHDAQDFVLLYTLKVRYRPGQDVPQRAEREVEQDSSCDCVALEIAIRCLFEL
jgi:hypothetical protein